MKTMMPPCRSSIERGLFLWKRSSACHRVLRVRRTAGMCNQRALSGVGVNLRGALGSQHVLAQALALSVVLRVAVVEL